jgi:hypothetical protein
MEKIISVMMQTYKDIEIKLSSVGISINATFILLAVIGVWFIYKVIYGLFFSPARHIPGPFLTRFGYLHFYFLALCGSLSSDINELHKKYGNNYYTYAPN